MIRTIGIDLGTTNTVAAYMKRGEPREIRNFRNEYMTPSALALTPQGELLVGEDARTRGTGKVMSFKPDMGTDKTYEFNGRQYTPMELSALILRNVKKYVEKALGEPVLRAVITVPAWFSDRAIVETREAGLMAGFYVVKIFSEPMAAALSWGVEREETDPKTMLVYDLGGGTFDISVLMVTPGNFAALDHEGDVHLGGDDFDVMITDFVRRRFSEKQGVTLPNDKETSYNLKLACEKAKINLSTDNIAQVHLAALGKDWMDVNVEITREELESMIRPWIAGPRKDTGEDGKPKKSTLEHVRIAISASDLTADTVDNILLVGGSTCIPFVPQVLGDEFGKEKIQNTLNPMFCVAHGAAIESTLIREIDCIKCHTKNPLDATKCQKCSAPLIGEEKIDCPKCFIPSPSGEKKCWKCGADLGLHSWPLLTKKCPEGHENPLQAAKCSRCSYIFDEGGIRCVECGKIIKQTDSECPYCGAEIIGRTEITSKSIGIELNDGSFSVIVKKGTNYPTEEGKPIHEQYSTPEDDAQIIRIIIRQGESEIASENEWLGDLMLGLPKGLPKNTPIDISIELDADRTLFVSAKLVDRPLSIVNAFIEMVPGGAQLLKDAQDLNKKAKDLKTRVDKEDQKKLDDLCAEIEKAVKQKDTRTIDMHKKAWEEYVAGSEARVNENHNITNSIDWAEYTLRVAADYIDNKTKTKIENLTKETQKALDSGNIKLATEKARQLDAAREELGNINIIVYASNFATHPNVSASTSDRLSKSLEELKAANRAGKSREVEKKLNELVQLIELAVNEIRATGELIEYKPVKSNTGFGTGT
jgi:molecular chaperone DnaK